MPKRRGKIIARRKASCCRSLPSGSTAEATACSRASLTTTSARRLTLRYRFFGGVEPRVAQVGAAARAADARAQRVREEAERNASIAWSDVQALEEQVAALRENYVASRRTRDVQVERFRVARGTINDVLEANESYFETAVAYVLRDQRA